MRRWWQRHFRGNPLLARETGLGGNRPLWRTPLVLAIALALLITLLHVAWEASHWWVATDIQSVTMTGPSATDAWVVASTGLRWDFSPGFLLRMLGLDAGVVLIEQAIFLLGLAAIPLWLSAWTW